METFAPLDALPFVFHVFTQRTDADTKATDYEQRLIQSLGYSTFARAEQIHSNGVAIVEETNVKTAATPRLDFPAVDALVTVVRGLPLLIRCADCAPIFLVDRVTPAIGLIHAGKKGVFANVAGAAVAAMPSRPDDILAVIGPSIGPCHYDTDLWAPLEAQLRAAGVRDIHNERRCTACHLDRYFSYRAERGQTGRMFAVLALR